MASGKGNAPFFVEEMRDVEEVEDSAAAFRVKVKGDKPFEVKWCDEEGGLDENDVRICMEDDEDNGVYTLLISDLKMCDSGVYTCVVKNKVSTTISEATLAIEPMPDQARHLCDKVAHVE